VVKTMETFRSDMTTYVKRWTRMRPRKYKWCRDMLFSENLHVIYIQSRLFLQRTWHAIYLGDLNRGATRLHINDQIRRLYVAVNEWKEEGKFTSGRVFSV